MLFTAPDAATFISGVIMQDETIRPESSTGTSLPQVLASRGIVPGIKVDTGAKPLALAPGETITEGLDGLRDHLAEYRGMGARFAKWRAVIHIADGLPSRACVSANAHALARYAALCQEASLVPIVEPEVLMDGVLYRKLDRASERAPCAARRAARSSLGPAKDCSLGSSFALVALLIAFGLAGCATRPVNPRIEHFDPATTYTFQRPSGNLDDRRTPDINIHVIDVSFDVLKDSAERDYLHRLPTSLHHLFPWAVFRL